MILFLRARAERVDAGQFAQVAWNVEDLGEAIARKYGVDKITLGIGRELLLEMGGEIQNQLESDYTERGWDSIDTLLDILEEEGQYPCLQQLRRQQAAKENTAISVGDEE